MVEMRNKPHIVIPTVKERDALCNQTVRQWEHLGYKVSVFPQDVALPCSACQQGNTALASLQKVYDSRPVVFCEDDVIIDHRIAEVQIPLEIIAITFYLPEERFYPPFILTEAQREHKIFPVINLKSWFGSQCIWLSPLIIEGLLVEEIDAADGLDQRIMRYLLRHEFHLYSIMPNLVQHLSPPSVTSKQYQPHKSITFENF